MNMHMMHVCGHIYTVNDQEKEKSGSVLLNKPPCFQTRSSLQQCVFFVSTLKTRTICKWNNTWGNISPGLLERSLIQIHYRVGFCLKGKHSPVDVVFVVSFLF